MNFCVWNINYYVTFLFSKLPEAGSKERLSVNFTTFLATLTLKPKTTSQTSLCSFLHISVIRSKSSQLDLYGRVAFNVGSVFFLNGHALTWRNRS